MGIKQTSLEIYSELSNSPVDWLLANVGDKIRIELSFRVATYFVGSTSTPFVLNNTDGYVGDGWFTSSANAFVGMNIGDEILVYNQDDDTSATFTIIDKLSDQEIQLDTPFGDPDNTVFAPVVVSLVKPITGVKYRWNFIENSDATTWLSKLDETSEQMLIHELIDATDPTVLDMSFVGTKPYQIGSATIEGSGETTGEYYYNEFKIIHYTYITPFMLALQYTDTINGIPPSYFTSEKCLKYVYNIQALYTYSDPSKYAEITSESTPGNTGWFNEKFNNIPTNYSIDDLEYRRMPSGILVSSLEMGDGLQRIKFKILNITDSPFSDNNTQFVLNFCKAPYDSSEYTSNSRTMNENFVFDRCLQTVGDAAVNGDNYGTGMQVLKNVTAEFISADEIEITATVEFGEDALDIIQESELPTFMIFVSIQNHLLDTEESDKVTLLVDFAEYYIDNSDPTLLINNAIFLRHFEEDVDTEGTGALEVFPEDECIAYNRFYIDKNGRETDDILIKSISFKIKVKNTDTLEEFVLDSFSNDVSASPLVGGLQYMDFSLNRIFHIPEDEPRKKIRIKRRSDLDAGGKYYYETYFPFIFRWEYFIKLLSANTDFFDASEPNNNLNHFWHHYASGDWKIYNETRILVEKNDELLSFKYEDEITTNDWDSNANWSPNSIKSYNKDSLVELYDPIAVKKYILGYDQTLIEALFEFTGDPIDVDNYVAVFGIETFEGSGVAERRRFSSVWASVLSDTWFRSIDGSDKAVIDAFDAQTVRVQALVDNSMIPEKPIFKISCRLYDLSPTVLLVSKLKEDGTLKKTEGSDADTMQKIKD